LNTRAGLVEARWILGRLAESAFFDTSTANDARAFSAAAIVWRRDTASGFSLGILRGVVAPLEGWSGLPGHVADILRPGARTTRRSPGDTVLQQGRDQILSVFSRLAFPGNGLELYGEYARTELPRSFRDAMLYPDHTRGYTAGLLWITPGRDIRARWRINLEATDLEQSPSFQDRHVGVWYTSNAVPQGFTHRGQVLGAAIGPGASAQWLSIDRLQQPWRLGLFLQRIRWNTDALSVSFPPNPSGLWCEFDVTLAPGVRGELRAKFRRISVGKLSAELALQNRQNFFFQNASGCPRGPSMRDLRNKSLTIGWTP
jgi:hypothetical protein